MWLMPKGPVQSWSWALFWTDQGPVLAVQSQKFPEPKNCRPGLPKTAKNQFENWTSYNIFHECQRFNMQLLQCLPFIYFFSTSFYPIWMKKINIYLQFKAIWLPPRFGLSLILTSPRTVVFFGPCLNELEGPGLVVQSGSLVLSGL